MATSNMHIGTMVIWLSPCMHALQKHVTLTQFLGCIFDLIYTSASGEFLGCMAVVRMPSLTRNAGL